ncbi:unnamed protein product, partial [Linum tenue]
AVTPRVSGILTSSDFKFYPSQPPSLSLGLFSYGIFISAHTAAEPFPSLTVFPLPLLCCSLFNLLLCSEPLGFWIQGLVDLTAMAEEHSESPIESVMDKISEKIHSHDSSSSSSSDSDSDSEKKKTTESPSSVKEKIFRLFGRERPVHHVLGGGKAADVMLWRNKKSTGIILGGATLIWVLFELVEYHLLTLVCHTLILSLALLFLWSNAHTFIHKSPPKIPEVHLPEEPVLQAAAGLAVEINQVLALLRNIALGKDLKKFLMVWIPVLNLLITDYEHL